MYLSKLNVSLIHIDLIKCTYMYCIDAVPHTSVIYKDKHRRPDIKPTYRI